MQLIYVGDPMCSWCYGFGKSLDLALRSLPEAGIEIVLGGVRAGATDVLDDAGKQFRLTHWARVEALSGLPFNRDALAARNGFVYDTEPVCRAMVLARRHVDDRALLRVMRHLQRAFYVDGRDTTDADTLLRLLTEALGEDGLNIDTDTLRRQWHDSALRAETAADFAQARRWGIRSFPALLVRDAAGVSLVTDGYLRSPELLALLQARWRQQVRATSSPDACGRQPGQQADDATPPHR